jgi:hypothetical protein
MARIIRRIAAGIGLLVVIGLATLAIALSYDAPCEAPPAIADGVTTIKAAVRRCYGPPEVLAVEDVEKPVHADNQMLVKVHAAALNPLDWHELRGTPYIMRLGAGFGTPTNARLGVDFSGTVEAVGKNVAR